MRLRLSALALVSILWVGVAHAQTVVGPLTIYDFTNACVYVAVNGAQVVGVSSVNKVNTFDACSTPTPQPPPPTPPPGPTVQFSGTFTGGDGTLQVNAIVNHAPLQAAAVIDGVIMIPVGANIATGPIVEFEYLSGTHTPPVLPIEMAVIPFHVPTISGQWEVRLIWRQPDGSYLTLATTPIPLTVQ